MLSVDLSARCAIRAIAATGQQPSAVLTQLNEAILRQNLEERFFTAVYALVTPGDGGVEVTLSNAGHPPGAVLRDVEARDDSGDQFGFDRLQALLATCTGRPAEGIARRLELAVLDHQGETIPDDIAILVLRAQT